MPIPGDGQRFLINLPLDDDRPQGIHIVHNWKLGNAAPTISPAVSDSSTDGD